MFVHACSEAQKYTLPVVVSTLLLDGQVKTGLGSFVVLNAEGWVATAGHIFSGYISAGNDTAKVVEYDQKVAEIEGDARLSKAQKHSQIIRLTKSNDWVRDRSIWFAQDSARVVDGGVYPHADLALCRLDPFDTSAIGGYPTFKRSANLFPGTSLVRVGYPFHTIGATYSNSQFQFEPGSLPVPLFPIEGIFTRTAIAGQAPEGYTVKMIETSSPGLRGQSGGPVLDREGAVWGIQSQTIHFPMGFQPKVKSGRREIEEHQFLNVGLAVHPETLEFLFARHGIQVDWVD